MSRECARHTTADVRRAASTAPLKETTHFGKRQQRNKASTLSGSNHSNEQRDRGERAQRRAHKTSKASGDGKKHAGGKREDIRRATDHMENTRTHQCAPRAHCCAKLRNIAHGAAARTGEHTHTPMVNSAEENNLATARPATIICGAAAVAATL